MRVAIFGTGARAVAIGRLLARAGNRVFFGDTRGDSAARAAREAEAAADTPYHEAAICDVIVFAAARAHADALVSAAGRIPPQTVIVDAMEGRAPGPRSGAELLAHKLDTHRLVRALVALAQPGASVALCGDDRDATAIVEGMFRSAGCVTYDRGPLSHAAEIEPPQACAGAA